MRPIQCGIHLNSYRRYERTRRGVITSAIYEKWITPYVHLAEVNGLSRSGFQAEEVACRGTPGVRPMYARCKYIIDSGAKGCQQGVRGAK